MDGQKEDARFETHTHSNRASRHYVIFVQSKRGVWHAVGKASLSASWITRQTEGLAFQNNFIYTTVIMQDIESEHEHFTSHLGDFLLMVARITLNHQSFKERSHHSYSISTNVMLHLINISWNKRTHISQDHCTYKSEFSPR